MERLDGEPEQGAGPGGEPELSSWRTATWDPDGVVSTRFPSPLLTVRMSPPGATARPSGPFRCCPRETVKPRPALEPRKVASGIPATRFASVSATYRTPSEPRPTPVGPMTRAAVFSCSAKPDPIVVLNWIHGRPDRGIWTTSRSTVPPKTVPPFAATVPFRTLVTNRTAWLPRSREAMSQGPLMPWPANVSRTCPHRSRTIRQPEPETLPLLVGSEPTITQPLRSTVRAVVRPTPPGQPDRRGLIWANSETWPEGVTSTIVVPVPCTLALSLKLLTRTLPCPRCPVLRGMTATPYGLTSPLPGTVDASVVT